MADILTPDLCIIGAGPGGLALAEEARALGASVVLVERNRMGGENASVGSIPSKALIASARHAHALRTGQAFGMGNDEPKISFRRVHDHIEEVVAASAQATSTARFEALGVTVLGEDAKFVDRHSIKAGETLVRARRFVLATGSRPALPDIPGLKGVPYLTTDTVFDITRKLSHLVVIGGGPVGVELAQAYRRLGADVTLIEAGTVLAKSDPELVGIALRRLREEGVVIHEQTQVTAIQARPLGIGVSIAGPMGESALDASHILVATGRRPSLDELDLDKAGIRRRKTNADALELSADLRTTNRKVYAIGDVAGTGQYANLAVHQAGLVARHALLGQPMKRHKGFMGHATFTDPELAEIGLSEPQAKKRYKTRYGVLRAGFLDNDRARANRRGEGLIKLVLDPSDTIIGAGIVGENAGELIAILGLAMANGLKPAQLAAFAAPYPTLAASISRIGIEAYKTNRSTKWNSLVARLIRLLP